MTPLHELAFFAAPGYRSRAYAQMMIALGIIPSKALIPPAQEPVWEGNSTIEVNIRGEGNSFSFAPAQSTRATLEQHGVPIDVLPSPDINAAPCIEAIRGASQEVILYSGFGGVLLQKPVLTCGKRFLHIHGGFAPTYKGSTAFYFSLLEEGTVGATALWLNEEIDGGPIIARRKYHPPIGLEIDRIADPIARADLLADVLSERVADGKFPMGTEQHEKYSTFFIIHPVLKHIALKRCGLVQPELS